MQMGTASSCEWSPVGFPDMNRLWVVDAVLLCHVIQEVEEEPDSDGRWSLGAEDGHEYVIHKLLQSALRWKTTTCLEQ